MLMIGERYAPFASLCCLILHKQTFCKIEPFDEIDDDDSNSKEHTTVLTLGTIVVHMQHIMSAEPQRRNDKGISFELTSKFGRRR